MPEHPQSSAHFLLIWFSSPSCCMYRFLTARCIPPVSLRPPPTVDPECRLAEVDQTKPSDHGATGGQVAHMRYQLPAEVTCTRCIMQMVHCELSLCCSTAVMCSPPLLPGWVLR